jgi:hypothetical protein
MAAVAADDCAADSSMGLIAVAVVVFGVAAPVVEELLAEVAVPVVVVVAVVAAVAMEEVEVSQVGVAEVEVAEALQFGLLRCWNPHPSTFSGLEHRRG